MNKFQLLEKRIRKEMPKAKIKIDEPYHQKTGVWWIDITIRRRRHVICWKKGKPFGFSDWESLKTDGYGTGANEIFPTVDAMMARLRTL